MERLRPACPGIGGGAPRFKKMALFNIIPII